MLPFMLSADIQHGLLCSHGVLLQVVIDFVVAGEVAAFRARERLSSAPVLEMPVHVPDIFC
jgi:hypothetical protein